MAPAQPGRGCSACILPVIYIGYGYGRPFIYTGEPIGVLSADRVGDQRWKALT
jgi:hypothetical protein